MDINTADTKSCVKKINTIAYGKDYDYLRRFSESDCDNLCIYGCGVNGELMCSYLEKCGKNIAFFVDKQAEIREFEALGKKVVSPSTFFEMSKKYTVIVSPDNYKPIVEYLIQNGIDKSNIICPFKLISKDILYYSDEYSPLDNLTGKIKRNSAIDTNGKPKATIFTILYNTPKGMLCRTIESVLNQTYSDFEYLIIDNGSTDDSSEIIKQYKKYDNRIKYIRLDKNVVWASSIILETLRDNIKTEYVAMIDSDDYYESCFLERAISKADECESDIVQVNTYTYGHEGFKYNYFSHYMGEDICLKGDEKVNYLLQRVLFVPTWGKLYTTNLFKNLIEMMLSYASEEERDRYFCLDISWMTYLALESKNVVLIDECMHVRTWRQGSSEQSDDHISKWLSSIVWAFRCLTKHDIVGAETQVYEESALMWLFALSRSKYDLTSFCPKDINYESVRNFLNRPICDKYRSNQNE